MTPNKFQHAGLDWIPHTPGDPMPCHGDTRVRVLFRNHEVCSKAFAAACRDWRKMMDEWDCIGWHPIEEQPDTAAHLANLNATIEQQAETLKVMNDALKEAHRIFGNLSHSQVVQRLCPDFAEVAELVRKSHDQHA